MALTFTKEITNLKTKLSDEFYENINRKITLTDAANSTIFIYSTLSGQIIFEVLTTQETLYKFKLKEKPQNFSIENLR